MSKSGPRAVLAALLVPTSVFAQPLVIASNGAQVASMPAACTPQVYGGHGYFFCHIDTDFLAAQSFCQSFGAELASLGSRFENDLVAGFVQSLGRGRHWLGYSDAEREGSFISLDGSPLSFSAWAYNEPNNVGDEDCVELDGGGAWNDVPCAQPRANVLCEETSFCTTEAFRDHVYRVCSRPGSWRAASDWCSANAGGLAVIDDELERAFVTEHTRGLPGPVLLSRPAPPANPRPGTFVCEDPTPCVRRFFDHHTYLFCTRPGATGHSAAQACRSLGAQLATVDSVAEDSFVYANFALFRRAHFYIGLSDEGTEGSFYGPGHRPSLYSRWIPGEPNNNLGDENCVELADLGWNDVPCEGDTKGAFVCELP